MQTLKLTQKDDLEYFRKRALKLIGVDFPLSYFEQGFVRAIKDSRGRIIAGYAIVTDGPLRTLSSLPDNFKHKLNESEIFELTALWVDPNVDSGLPSCLLWCCLSKDFLSLKNKKSVIYAYDLYNKKLAKLYGLANPTEIYRGKVKKLEGNLYESEDIIETIPRMNVVLSPIICFPNFLTKMFFKRKTFMTDLKPLALIKRLTREY